MAIPVPAPVAAGSFEGALKVASRAQDATTLADALSTLQRIVSVDGQPPGTLGRVVDLARQHMTTADTAMVWQVAVDLALATGDPQLRGVVARVATGETEPSFSVRLHLRLWVRSAAQRALNRTSAQ